VDSFLFCNIFILIYNSACTIAEQQHLTVELGTEDDVLLTKSISGKLSLCINTTLDAWTIMPTSCSISPRRHVNRPDVILKNHHRYKSQFKHS